MKKRALCIALALLLCLSVTVSAFADGDAETPPERALITAVYGLKHISGSTYKMWAQLDNPTGASVSTTLALYDASYNYITSVGKTSTSSSIGLGKNVTLSSGIYHLRLNYTVDGTIHSFERTYSI